jgi:CoA:oxalate CoA-transferase
MTHPRPLDGLRVLDLSRAVAGPFAGRILADLGADVVKAELPGTDVAQSYGKVIRGRSGLYSHVNAGKRSVLLDLHQPAGVERLLDLAAACDVLVENFRPGVLDRFGAGWPVLAAANEGDAVHLRFRPGRRGRRAGGLRARHPRRSRADRAPGRPHRRSS